MKVLVVVTDYPNLQGGLALAYVRTRNVYYKERGMEVEVLNFQQMKIIVLMVFMSSA